MQQRLIKVKKNNNSGSRTDRVAARVRKILSQAFLEDNILLSSLSETPVTISSVNVSPDLKNATVFVVPLGLDIPDGFEQAMNAAAPEFNRVIARELKTKYTPRVHFKADYTFERASKLHSMMNNLRMEDDLIDDNDDTE